MPKRTIKSVYFEYRTEEGSYVTARRGQTVDIPEGMYLDRGDRHGAFVTEAVDVPVVDPTSEQITPDAGQPGSGVPTGEGEQDAPLAAELVTVLEGNVDEVLAYAAGNPDQVQALLDIEKAQEKPRKGVVEGLTKLIEG